MENNNLSIIDTRNEPTTKYDWMVIGTIYEDKHDTIGTDICEGFDCCRIAGNFVVNTLST